MAKDLLLASKYSAKNQLQRNMSIPQSVMKALTKGKGIDFAVKKLKGDEFEKVKRELASRARVFSERKKTKRVLPKSGEHTYNLEERGSHRKKPIQVIRFNRNIPPTTKLQSLRTDKHKKLRKDPVWRYAPPSESRKPHIAGKKKRNDKKKSAE